MNKPRTIHLSASSISALKACPQRYRLGYDEGLRVVEDTESLRMGTNWHLLQEVYRNARQEFTHEEAFEEAITHLNNAYIPIPDYLSDKDAATERAILAASFAGYCWYHANDPLDSLTAEHSFKMPLHHPATGLPIPIEDVVRVGKIDEIIRRNGKYYISDYKSTAKAIDADSDFWNHLQLDTQISMYVMAGKELTAIGELEAVGVPRDAEVAGAFYDVWHKPAIRPKKLTQADSKKFAETGDYMGTHFEVILLEDPLTVAVDGEFAEAAPGKKEGSFAIRETPEMYGARLLADIYEQPENYFCRREISRTDKDIRAFREELYNIYQNMKSLQTTGQWYKNEHSCQSPFRCAYTSICWHHIPFENGETPQGMKRIYAKPTHEGRSLGIQA